MALDNEELNKRRATSKVKTSETVTLDTRGTYNDK